VKVAHVDALERRIQKIQKGEDRGGALVAQPERRDAEHGQGAQRERGRLEHEQRARSGDNEEERHEEIHDRREVVAPRVHLRQADVGAGAAGEVPGQLDVVAEVERMRAQRQVSRQRDEGV
jgi:hypothetical protein